MEGAYHDWRDIFSLKYVNKQNVDYIHVNLYKKPLQSLKVVWCGVISSGIIGPDFFKLEDKVVTVHSYRQYFGMLRNFLMPETRRIDIVPTGWCYSACCCSVDEYSSWKNNLTIWWHSLTFKIFGFESSWIYLWGYLKSRSYKDEPCIFLHNWNSP